MRRREFLAAGAAVMLGAGVLHGTEQKRRVAVIGHTGRGNYGHGLDTVWLKILQAEIVAVADGNEAGLAAELKKLQIERGYSDYRKMLSDVRPEFVSVAPRHSDQHHDMTLAAIEAGARGVYVEKPFCRTPAEADDLVAACRKHGAKIAVAHRNRYHPTLAVIDRLIADGGIGRLLEIRGRGKGDHRGGGEDLWVLGCHVMNLVCYFAGEPKSCSAIMLQDGRRVSGNDIGEGAEGLGPLAGNEVHARYETAKGVVAFYDSIANDGTGGDAYCLQLIGSEGTVTIHIDRDPVAHLTPGNPFKPTSEPRPWIPITTAGIGEPENRMDLVESVHDHVLAVRDLMDACDSEREPLCSVHDGAVTVEMICAVFESHRRGGETIEFPLQERRNPLQLLRDGT